ncbi:MAG: asparagine synthase (glutamine-hydrolyzing) [Thermoanaerobaculia bacterium]
MCGIVGLLGPDLTAPGDGTALAMLDALAHLGPDGAGLVRRAGCRLGVRRLAIIDLAASSEPFANEDVTVTCVCNGQIYNSAELRRELEGKGHVFRTNVDTEVVLHLWEEHGVDLVQRLNGMFAFGIWDDRQQTLMLGRDRAGEKPLFYWTDGGRLVFASEMRALLAHPAIPARLDPLALLRYLAHGFVPAPLTPIAGIRKLPAAHFLVARRGRVELFRYWDLADWFAEPGSRDPRCADEIVASLEERLAVAVERRSRSDVPFGVFLSGGIDSSTVLSYISEAQGPGVPAFSIGHADPSFDESSFAAEVARLFKADLHTLTLHESDLEEGLRQVGRHLDEPLGDASTIPTYLLARFARQRVKVVLTGEGGDELFGGYPTYLGHRLADGLRRVPAPIRRALVAAVRRCVPVTMGNVGLDYLIQRFAYGLEQGPLERHHAWFGSIQPDRLQRLLAPSLVAALDERDIAAPFASAGSRRKLAAGLDQLLYTDFVLYLQDDLLTKVDRTSMLVSLEARAPFLDHELAQFVAGIPARLKVRRLTTKAILRRAMRRRLPASVLSRRKRGFNIPFSRWVLHGLGDSLRERFSRERVEARGLLSFAGVKELLDEHMSRRADHRRPLFTLLALDLWCDRTFGESRPIPVGEAGGCAADAVLRCKALS